MPKSTYLSNNFINVALRNTPFTPPTTLYVALYTASPGVGGGGTEVSTSGTGYARQTVTFGSPTSGQSMSTGDVLFPVATADYGTIVAYALLDASLSGNLLYFGTLSSSRYIASGDQVKFPAGQLIVTES